MSNELTLDRVAIKKQAKKLLDGKTWSLIGWFALYGFVLLLCAAVSWFMPMPLQNWVTNKLLASTIFFNYNYDIVQIVIWLVFIFIKFLLFSAMSFPFYVCMSGIPLAMVEGNTVTWKSVLAPIGRARYFIEYSITGAMTYSLTWLWSFLLFVPGIAARYRYSFAKYLYVRDNEQTAGEVVETSKKMALGFKMSMFVIDLSFIGWFLVGLATCGVGLVYMLCYSSVTHAIVFKNLEDNFKSNNASSSQNTETEEKSEPEIDTETKVETDLEEKVEIETASKTKNEMETKIENENTDAAY